MVTLETIKSLFNIQPKIKLFARNTLWMSLGFVGRTGVQVVYFIIVARTLKPESYGVYAGSLALVYALMPFVSWGSGNILIKQVSRHPDHFPEYWGMVLSVTLRFACLMFILSGVAGALLLSPMVAWSLVLPIAAGSFFGDNVALVSGQAFQAHQRLSRTSLISVLMAIFRLASALLLLILPVTKTAENWAVLFMVSGLLSGVAGLILVRRELGRGRWGLGPMKGKWREGFFFAIGLSAQGAYNDIDKTLLVRLASGAAAGMYAAAYRMMDCAFIPVMAMIYAGYPRFFQEGEKGINGSSRYALRLLPWAAGWSLLVGLSLPLLALLVPFILGTEYAETAQILLWLAPIPLFKAFHNLAANALTGSGFQGVRSGFQIGIAFLNFGLNLWWIPRYGWLGAAWSSLFSDGLLAVSLWGLTLALAARKGDKSI
jgi:O-antigen/teichoic acid export membrane protein